MASILEPEVPAGGIEVRRRTVNLRICAVRPAPGLTCTALCPQLTVRPPVTGVNGTSMASRSCARSATVRYRGPLPYQDGRSGRSGRVIARLTGWLARTCPTGSLHSLSFPGHSRATVGASIKATGATSLSSSIWYMSPPSWNPRSPLSCLLFVGYQKVVRSGVVFLGCGLLGGLTS